MKRTLLLIITLIFFTGLSAQSLVLKNSDGAVITGTTIDLLVNPELGYGNYHVNVMNNSSSAMNVKVRVHEVNLLEGLSCFFCWESCYAPGVLESPGALEIGAGETRTDFEGDITFTTGLKGLYTTKYVFFNAENPDDSSFVIVNYNLGYLGTPENSLKSAKVSNAYPNPAISNVYIDYRLPSNVTNAKIKISNLLGNTLEVVDLTAQEGKATVNVSNLKNGVYFYSLMINNSATVTRKFIVNR